jgi:O-antigen ligase
MIDQLPPHHVASRFLSGVIFLFPALALTAPFGVGLIEAAILLAMVFFALPLWRQRRQLFGSAGWIVAAFVVQLLLVTATMTWSGFSLRHLDNPSKQLLAVGFIGLIMLARPKVETFWYGLFAGTMAAAGIAVYQRFVLDLPRAPGFHMAIMFGDIAIVMGLMGLASIPLFARRRVAILPYVAFLAGIAASVLSGTRGGWVAIALAFIPLYFYGSPVMRRKMMVLITAITILFTGACFIPDLQVKERMIEASSEVEQYYETGKAYTSVGARLEMWHGALIMFSEQPVHGVGYGKFNAGLRSLIARGKIDPALANFRHAHNELLHMLATAGLIGAAVLLFLYAAPLAFFIRVARRNDAAKPYALAGILLVVSFIDFGLTQVLFSHHLGNAFYALSVSILAGACIMLRQNERAEPVVKKDMAEFEHA